MKNLPKREVMFGYMDESGMPGVALNSRDYFVVCVVVVRDREESLNLSDAIDDYRRTNNLPNDYEFHYIDNSKKVRAGFIGLIKYLDFGVVAVSIKKNRLKQHASYAEMAKLLLEQLAQNCPGISIEMDKNPNLYKELRSQKNCYDGTMHFKEKESRGHNLIQLADYVTAIKTRALKHNGKTSTGEVYKSIADKIIGAVDV